MSKPKPDPQPEPKPEKAPQPPTDLRAVHGPFDIIGDVHGCADELIALLAKLGYSVRLEGEGAKRRAVTTAPAGRRAFFVGDFVDRGPSSPDVLRIAMAMDARGQALAVIGNHDDKLAALLKGRKVTLAHGLEGTVEQLKPQGEAFRAEVEAFLAPAVSTPGSTVGASRSCTPASGSSMLGRNYPAARAFCLYGDTSGKLDAAGLPERFNWALDYRGEAAVIYGHTPVAEVEWINNTLCIDTGCVFGGKLTALRWPERELVSVPAREAYAELRRGFGLPPLALCRSGCRSGMSASCRTRQRRATESLP